jgi:hypothetical protein
METVPFRRGIDRPGECRQVKRTFGTTAPPVQRQRAQIPQRGQLLRQGAPLSNQRFTSARSASVIWVALFIGISFSTTTCW